MRNYVRGEPPPTEDYSEASEYPDAVECAEEISTYFLTFGASVREKLTNYSSKSQTHANKIAECNTLQSQYEQDFCSYRSDLLHVCSELDHCFEQISSLFDATNALILESNETRFRSFLVAKKVICYVDVLLRNLTINAIHQCDNKQINTSELNFTFPPLPTKKSCDVNLVSVKPCDNAWLQNKYTDKDWYLTGIVENAQCPGLRAYLEARRR